MELEHALGEVETEDFDLHVGLQWSKGGPSVWRRRSGVGSISVAVVRLERPGHGRSAARVPLYREFAKLDGVTARLPDETTILRFRHLLERHDLAVDMLRVVNDILQAKGLMMRTGTAVDATLISAPSSTKNADGERDPEMKQTKKGNNWYFESQGPFRGSRPPCVPRSEASSTNCGAKQSWNRSSDLGLISQSE